MSFLRNVLISFLFIGISAVWVAALDWHERFAAALQQGHIDEAVRVAVTEENKHPEIIIQTALKVEGFHTEDKNRTHLVKALFCNIASPDQVQDAALKNGLSEQEVWEGYQWALEECRRQMEESYNYSPSEEGNPAGKASPWNFR